MYQSYDLWTSNGFNVLDRRSSNSAAIIAERSRAEVVDF